MFPYKAMLDLYIERTYFLAGVGEFVVPFTIFTGAGGGGWEPPRLLLSSGGVDPSLLGYKIQVTVSVHWHYNITIYFQYLLYMCTKFLQRKIRSNHLQIHFGRLSSSWLTFWQGHSWSHLPLPLLLLPRSYCSDWHYCCYQIHHH